MTKKGGVVFTGKFLDDKMVNGEVILNKTQERYVGDLRADNPDGLGVLTKADGFTYKGSFSKGLFEGRGILKDESAGVAHYKGDFKQGKFHGEGHIKWSDLSKPFILDSYKEYKGGFSNGKPHGNGAVLYADGKALKGLFARGAFVTA